MADLLLELYSEEIPARMQRPAAAALEERLRTALRDARLDFEVVRSFVSPQRLALTASGLPARQPDRSIEKKGPRVGAPDAAIEGFCRGAGVSRDALTVRTDEKGVECYFLDVEEKGRATAEALTPLLENVIAGYTWPKSMRWHTHDTQWVRPLKNICCLLDKTVIPVSFGPVKANDQLYGHRFLSPQAITLAQAGDYEAELEKLKVIVDSHRREQLIRDDLTTSDRGDWHVDEALLEEVSGLVEYPTVQFGRIDAGYMSLPAEVLRSEMRGHQKYFAFNDNGRMSERFALVSNIVAKDGGAAVIAGNERVLRARLADGRFFWEQDRRKPLSDWGDGLADVVFHAKLGSVADKVVRLQKLAARLAESIPGCDAKLSTRAATLCKADLTTGMVGEFPELQGIMGRYYALEQKEAPEVADAIRDHYQPLGPNSPCPNAPVTVAVSLADKLDSLVGLFLAGEAPTGSKDPFALRRAALGVIRLISENSIRITLRAALKDALWGFPSALRDEAVVDAVMEFITDRLKTALKQDGLRHDLVTAAFLSGKEDDVVRLTHRAKALGILLSTDDGVNLLAACNRAGNIVRIEEKKSGQSFAGDVDAGLLHEMEEHALHGKLQSITPALNDALATEDYAAAMRALAELRQPLDAFFDAVTVNAEDPILRENRLRLLAMIRATMGRVADFDAIEG